jgi:hypothetical protein
VSNPLISLLIPTRDRPDTLAICLANVTRNISQDLEFVVQDNCSGPETAVVVERARTTDGRIRYERSTVRLSQRQNFEDGLRSCRGDYLAIIGDDDGISPGALDQLAAVLQCYRVDAVRWNRADYIWPSLSADGVGFLNLDSSLCAGGARIVPSAPFAAAALRASVAGSWQNILIYHGMISRAVYQRMRSGTGGLFFDYPMPDVYAHMMLPFFCDGVLRIDDIVTIYGLSGHSAGSSWSRPGRKDPRRAVEGDRWIRESRTDAAMIGRAWNPEIRAQRYHEFCVLKLANELGVLGKKGLDEARWTRALLTEIARSPQLALAFHTTEPQTDFDVRFFKEIRSRFPRNEIEALPAFERHVRPDSRLPSLRLSDIDPELPDTVDGAALALDRFIGSWSGRKIVPSQDRTDTVRLLLGHLAARLRDLFPLVTSCIVRHPAMPSWLWRKLKTCVEMGTENAELQARLLSLSRKNTAHRSPKADSSTALQE